MCRVMMSTSFLNIRNAVSRNFAYSAVSTTPHTGAGSTREFLCGPTRGAGGARAAGEITEEESIRRSSTG